MKGHTTIELTDVNTGEVEVFEDENIITNAADIYMNTLLTGAALNSSSGAQGFSDGVKLFPLYDSVFGGVKLFENVIEEDVNNFKLPNVGTHPIVGYAGNKPTTGTNPKLGSRNIAETIEIENGLRIVWDFATSEANGTIASVCLTNSVGGTYEFDINTSYQMPWINIKGFQLAEYENGIFTLISFTGPLRVRRYKIPTTKVNLAEVPFGPTLIEEVQVSEGVSTLLYRDSGDSYWYCVTSVTTTEIKYRKIDKTTYELTDVTASHNLSLYGLNSRTNANYAIWKGYIYAPGSASGKIYKINIVNASNVVEMEIHKWATGGYAASFHMNYVNNDMMLTNGILFDINGGGYALVDNDFNVSGGSFYHFRSYDGRGYYASVSSLVVTDSGIYVRAVDSSSSVYDTSEQFCFDNSNIMSINNLETPVIKTADKTMKITYTLLYEEEVPV